MSELQHSHHPPTMDQEVVAVGHDVQVVDPDVRGYVYSLVTAVSVFLRVARVLDADTLGSWEVSMAKMPTNMSWETTHWHVCATSSGG